MAKKSGRTEITQNVRIREKVRGSEDLVISGRIDGEIILEGDLTVVNSGIVKAAVQARSVQVDGIVVGDVAALQRISLGPEARVKGDLAAPVVHIVEGARVSGNLSVGDRRASTVEPQDVDDEMDRPPLAAAPSPRPVLREAPSLLPDDDDVDDDPEENEPAAVAPFSAGSYAPNDPRRRRVVIKKR